MAASETAVGGSEVRSIQRLTPDDAESLCPLSIEAGWNQVAADWRLMLGLGRGFGVRGEGGQWIASALALPLGEVTWLSMVLVTQPARKQGLGTRLLSHCLAELEKDGIAAGLDATELGRPIYLPLGFRDIHPLSRWHLHPGDREAVAPPDGISIRTATLPDLPRIGEFDRQWSGFDRLEILANSMRRAPAFARVAVGRDGRIAGYALGRDGYRAMHVGPVVANGEPVGLALLSNTLAATDQSVIIDVPDLHKEIRRWLEAQGASAPRSFMRMLRGGGARIGDETKVFALAGPELA